jgi:hypothetical protein
LCVGVSVEDAVRVGLSVKAREGRFSSALRVSGDAVAVPGLKIPIVDSGGGKVGIPWQEEASVTNKIKPVKSSPFFMKILLLPVFNDILKPEQISAAERRLFPFPQMPTVHELCQSSILAED